MNRFDSMDEPRAVEERADKIDLHAYLRPVLERKWSVIGIAVLVMSITVIVVMQIKPLYRSTTTLLVAQPPSLVGIEKNVQPESEIQNYFGTQMEILRSRSLAEQVIQALSLQEHQKFAAPGVTDGYRVRFLDRLPSQWVSSLPAVESWPDWLRSSLLMIGMLEPVERIDEVEASKRTLKIFQDRLTVEPVSRSQLVNISFDAHDSQLAARVANAVGEIYIASDREARLNANLATTGDLNTHIEELRQKLIHSEQMLQDFREQEGIIEQNGRTFVDARIDALSQQLVQTEQRVAKTRYDYLQASELRGESPDYLLALPIAQQDPLLQNLLLKQLELEGELAKFGKLVGGQHPKIVTLNSDLDALRKAIGDRLDFIVGNLQRDYSAAQADLEEVEQTIRAAEENIQQSHRISYEHQRLQREVESNRHLYNLFLTRLKEMQAVIQTANARIVDEATAASIPHKPDRRKLLVVGVMAGLFLGLAWALFREFTDNKLYRIEDAEARFDVPPLGFLPLLKLRREERGNNTALALYCRNHPRSFFAEGMRTIQTGVIYSSLDEPRKVIVVTSCLPDEGKSTVATNLALSLGGNTDVLLIDADLRQPSLARSCGLDSEIAGLSQYAADRETLQNCLHRIPNSRVWLLPSGVTPPNPLDLLSSKRFAAILGQFKQRYQYIVIDSPPLLAVSDGVALSKLASDMILVVRAGATTHQTLRMAIKKLQKIDAPVTGMILNQVKAKHQTYYGYGYGNVEEMHRSANAKAA